MVWLHSPINGSPSETYSTSSSLLKPRQDHLEASQGDYLHTFVVCAYLIRAMSSMRPPLPLYKQDAFTPNLLLATDSKSDRDPYTATTWAEKMHLLYCVYFGVSLFFQQNGNAQMHVRYST